MRRSEGDGAGQAGLWGLLGALLWATAAARRSLWSDEFHALHHALRPDLGSFLASVREDNHPPLAFLLERWSVQLLGTSPLALRLPSILVGLVALALFLRLARRATQAPPWAAGLLFLASSYCLVSFTEARMYGLLFLAGVGVLAALERELRGGGGPGPRSLALALWVTVGLHAHYYFLHVLAVLALGLVAAALGGCVAWRTLRHVAAMALLGVLSWLPWALYGFRVQLTHALPPGGLPAGLGALASSVPHLFFLNTRLAGGAADWVARVGGVLVLGGLLLGLTRLRPRAAGGAFRLVFAMLALGLPAWGWCVAHFVPRSTFGWRYLAAAAPAAMLLLLRGLAVPSQHAARALPQRVGFIALLLAMGVVTAVNWALPGREDYRGAVCTILAQARPGDVLLVKPPWDPDPIVTETPWHYYRKRVERPTGAVEPLVLGFEGLDEALHHPRVWFWRRDPYQDWVPRTLRKAFQRERVWKAGPDLELYLYSDPATVR